MRNLGYEPSRGIEVFPTSKSDIATSRRNLMSAAALLGGLAATVVLAPTMALADNGNGNNGNGNNGHGNSGNGHRANCYLKGTQILTLQGERSIEDLRIGDLLLTVSGEAKPIKWIGRRRFDRGEEKSWDDAVAPVKIARGAFNGELPHSDLYVSASHRFYINGLLISAGDLINGSSIARVKSTSSDVLEYLHIELESHEVILAHGAPAETLVGNADRMKFDNFDEYVALYGASLTNDTPCAPVIAYKGRLQALRGRLRGVLAPICDRRQPLEVIQDELARQAHRRLAA